MANASKTFEVKFIGNTKGLKNSFSDLQKDAGALGKSVTGTSNMMKAALAGITFGAVVKGLQSSVMAASNLSESISKANVVFGKNAQAVQAWSQTTSKAFGINRQAALEAAGTYGNLFRAFGLTEQQSYMMSTSLVELAADMASFNNTSVDDALLALRSGLSGETEPLKKFGIALTDVRLKEQAVRMGLIKTTSGVLPQAIKTQAAYALIMKDSALAQGDVSRTAGGLANQLKFLKAGLEDAKAGFGEVLLPVVLNVVMGFNEKLLPAIQRVLEALKMQGAGGGLHALGVEIANVTTNLTGAAKWVKEFVLLMIGMKVVMPIIMALRASWIAVGAAIEGTATLTVLASAVMKRALASTGIGLLIVAAGELVARIIDVKLASEATDKTIRIFESNGTKYFNGVSFAAAGTIKTINAVALAASRAADQVENAGIMDVKRKRIAPIAVAVPTISGGAGASGGAGKTSAAIATLSAAAKTAQENVAKLNDALAKGNDILAQSKDAYKSFKDGVAGAINGIIDFTSAANAETGTFLENLVKQADTAAKFGSKIQTLLSMGLSESAISQVLQAGADAGTKIADEIIAGGASVVDQVNTLVSATKSVADTIGEAASSQFYSAGISAGQALVDGVKAAISAAGFGITAEGTVVNQAAINQVAAQLATYKKSGGKLTKKEKKKITDLATQLGVEVPAMAKGGIVTKPTLALIGEAGPEAVVPLNRNNMPTGNTINVTVNAGMGADGAQIGREIVDAIKKYERTSGPVFASA